ncbi:type IV pilus biogenesis protein PilP [Acidithiobacillus sp.]
MMAKNVKKMVAASMGLMMIPIGAIAAPLPSASLAPKVLSGASLAVSPPAIKAKSSAVVHELTVHDLTVMEEQGALLQQQLKNAQLRQEIANAQKTAHTGAVKPASAILGSSSFNGPSVLLLTGSTGSNGHYTATIQLPNGQIAPAVIGNALPGGYRITKISSNGVWTVRDGRTEALPFAVASGSGGNYAGQALGAPLLGTTPPQGAPLLQGATLPDMAGLPPGANPMLGANSPAGMQPTDMQPAGQP